MIQEDANISRTTEDEKKWVKMLSEGKSAKETARAFKINENTFAYKLNLLRERFGCENTSGLIAFFLRNKLID